MLPRRPDLKTKKIQFVGVTCPRDFEPGIYVKEFGIRSEVDVYVDENEARVTGAIQNQILPLLA